MDNKLYNSTAGSLHTAHEITKSALSRAVDEIVNNFGTQIQCWSQNFWKSVRYLSEICQKTVSYKNVSENSHKCVRILSENCQMQISVRTLPEKIWKCIGNVSNFKNVSENGQSFIQKTV